MSFFETSLDTRSGDTVHVYTQSDKRVQHTGNNHTDVSSYNEYTILSQSEGHSEFCPRAPMFIFSNLHKPLE